MDSFFNTLFCVVGEMEGVGRKVGVCCMLDEGFRDIYGLASVLWLRLNAEVLPWSLKSGNNLLFLIEIYIS